MANPGDAQFFNRGWVFPSWLGCLQPTGKAGVRLCGGKHKAKCSSSAGKKQLILRKYKFIFVAGE
jgi:hypothetical protein